ncbi:MAG: type II secretion system F family protein [Proteobacteria bacterium]|nr:MAG: type II secretion system F family protein [Pseudomonadota bacterium]
MGKFYYKGIDANGTAVNGAIDAGDSWLARKELGRLQLSALELHESSGRQFLEKALHRARTIGDTVSVEERLVFLSQLETGMAVGIPILQLLDIIEQEVRHEGLRAAVKGVAKDIAQGSSLHEAFARHPKYFDETFVGLVRTGEASGQLEKILGQLFRLTEQSAENRARVKSALFYPVIVIFVLVFVVFAICYFVIPKIKAFLGSFGQELPLVTRVVVAASDFLIHYGFLVVIAMMGIWWAFRQFLATPAGRLGFHRFVLKLPIFGPFLLQVELNNFCVVLDLLLGSGIPLSDGLEMLQRSQSNQVVRDDLARTRELVVGGSTLKGALAAGKVFPRSLISLIGVGEEAGRIPEVLRRMAKHYQLQIDHRLQNLPKLIEPILLAVIFVFVLVLALAVFLPIWQMSSAINSAR